MTPLVTIPEQAPVSGYVEYQEGDAYRLKPSEIVPSGYIYCLWHAALYSHLPWYEPQTPYLTLAEHQRMLDVRAYADSTIRNAS
jgi:hypothetical protein